MAAGMPETIETDVLDLDLEETPSDPVSGWRVPLGLFFHGVPAMVAGVLLLAGLHGYVGYRLIGQTALGDRWSALGWSTLVGLGLSMPFGMASARGERSSGAVALQWVAYLWTGTFGLLVVALGLTDLGSWLYPLAPRTKAAGVTASVGSAVAWGVWRARTLPTVTRIRIPISSLGTAFHGFRILQLSDLHIGQTRGKRELEKVVQAVNRLKPDLVAITGDLAEGYVDCLRDELEPLSRLEASCGIFFVTGNHEYYYGGGAWETELRQRGLTVLHNSHRLITRGEAQLAIAGVTDLDGGEYEAGHHSDPARALRGIPAEVPRILLAHQPATAQTLRDGGASLRVDLQLSGHTHGGQLWPFAPLVRIQQPVMHGLKRLWGTWVYTSRGTGYWGPPMRLGAPPEISEIMLESLPSA